VRLASRGFIARAQRGTSERITPKSSVEVFAIAITAILSAAAVATMTSGVSA
jgi:hypothetical protein